jgi:hypothetical protein
MYAINACQCEPHHQHQNYAERRFQEVKKLINTLLHCSGSPPPSLWLLCVLFVVYQLNRLSTDNLQWKTPVEAATGQIPDMYALLAFHWFELVYFKSTIANPSFP